MLKALDRSVTDEGRLTLDASKTPTLPNPDPVMVCGATLPMSQGSGLQQAGLQTNTDFPPALISFGFCNAH
jgi:hypothetical protein